MVDYGIIYTLFDVRLGNRTYRGFVRLGNRTYRGFVRLRNRTYRGEKCIIIFNITINRA